SNGSVVLAIGHAVRSVALWFQGQIAQVLLLTRASTSVGSDLDSWMADFFFARAGAAAATGQVTFSRFTPTAQAIVPIGAPVSTGPAGQIFAVTLDTANSAYNAGL